MYGKIFDSIYEGTLYGKWEALVTFQQLIVLCDADGIIDMTPQAISSRTSIPLKIINKGLRILAKPDIYSRTPDQEGRRIELIDSHRPWGWHIVNHKKYQEMRDAEMIRAQTRERVRKHRAQRYGNASVTDGNASKRYTDTDTDTDTSTKTLSASADGAFSKFWEAYPRKTARKKALDAFRRSRIANGLLDVVLAAVETQKQTEQWQRGVIPHASTWLNQGRWEDDVASLPSLGECTWNVHGNREPGMPKCNRPATVEKQGLVYCKTHAERA